MITDDFNTQKSLWSILKFIIWSHVGIALSVFIGYAVISILPNAT